MITPRLNIYSPTMSKLENWEQVRAEKRFYKTLDLTLQSVPKSLSMMAYKPLEGFYLIATSIHELNKAQMHYATIAASTMRSAMFTTTNPCMTGVLTLRMPLGISLSA